MDIGIDSMTFQYYHLQVLLTRHDETDRDMCLTGARQAIQILDRLVSSSAEVYNGITW
jgi:hypothetical protein